MSRGDAGAMAAPFGLALAGGGTGGHLFPALAVAREFRRRDPATRVLYLGVAGKMEERLVPREGLSFHGLRVRAVRGGGPLGAARGLLLGARAFGECRRALARFGADLLLGVGGYSSAPAALAAWSLGVPVVLQEQNTVPGLANRLLARIARRVFVAFEPAARHFPRGRTVCTGNPLRADALGPPAPVGERPGLRVLVLGGSQGAQGLNRLVAEALPRLAAAGLALEFVHQSGPAGREALEAAYRGAGLPAQVHEFLEGMGARYAAADLVVARAGAGTVAEVAANARPAILVPYPHAASDHQRANARWLAERGGALLVEETPAGAPQQLADAITTLARDRGRLRAMAEASGRAGVRDAAARIVDECLALAGSGG